MSKAQLNQRAIVTGVQGQDGYYLSRMLLDRGYQVTGISRRHSSKDDQGPVHYDSEYREIAGDICDTSFMMSLIKKEQPNEFYTVLPRQRLIIWSGFTENHMGCLHVQVSCSTTRVPDVEKIL